ncbi:MAG: endopeptidase La [Ktedonobacterales bacterium]
MFNDKPHANDENQSIQSDDNQTADEPVTDSPPDSPANEEPDSMRSLPHGPSAQADPSPLDRLGEQEDESESGPITVLLSGHDASDLDDNDEERQVELPDELPILPLKDTVVYPSAVSPLGVGKERSIQLIDEVMHGGSRLVGLVAQKDAEVEVAGPDDCFRIGTVARIVRILRIPDGTVQIIVQGLERIVIDEFIAEQPYLKAHCHLSPEIVPDDIDTEALKRAVIDQFQRLVNLVQYLPEQLALAAMNLGNARQVVYFIASNAQMDLSLRQQLLEMDSVRAKLDKVTVFLTRELELLELGKKIQSQAQEEMTKAQREYYLREQLKAIQEELGEESDEVATINQLREKIEEAHMPEEALKEAQRELSRLEKLPAISPEYGVIRGYLDTLVALPWDKSTGKKIDVPYARQVLDEDHYDLEKIKDRILEYLAVRRLREERQGGQEKGSSAAGVKAPVNREPILCFVGPPGVGKTSLGHSIARALGREFVRLSLGGIHDEAEIRGHRRTYIGALPGRILQSIRRAGTNDPVFMLDEVDKVASDWRGDPSSALLEVLDPEQNHSFRDNYLDIAFDLSKVMFIATANALDPIPAPLRDRMEVLELAGYTEEEKAHIARRYLLPKQIAANALIPDEVSLDDEALLVIIRDYTREAGVRNLEREIGTICRKVVKQMVEGQTGTAVITPERVHELLGRQRFFAEAAERIDRPGVVTGLVWTSAGGDIIFVEAAMMRSHDSQLTLTGQLGDVMKESAMTALSYVRSNATLLGIDPRVFEDNSLHIHVPAGSIPKDGPSAGVTMMTAIVSLALGRKVRSDVAMTGEISLRGKVLPIGGLKEKVLAAHRAGITTVIIPKRNAPDLEDLPKELRSKMTFVPVDDAYEVLANALEGGHQFRPMPRSMPPERDTPATGFVASSGNV